MFRLFTACAATAVLTYALTLSLRPHEGLAAAGPSFTPPCPAASYGANGNMGPVLCVVDNPVALHYFASIGRHTFALGPNATPGEVFDALSYDFKHGGTGPIMCSIYQLAAWRNQWHFGISPIDELGEERNLPAGWCPAPSFTDDLVRVLGN